MTVPAGLLTDYEDVETWQLDTITFGRVNTVGGASVYFGIDKVTGWDSSSKPRTGRLAKAAASGSYRSPNWRDDKIITLSGSATVPDEPTALKTKLMVSALCSDPNKLYTLRHQDALSGEDLLCEVELDDQLLVEVDYSVRPLEVVYSIQVAAPEPVRYSGTLHQASCRLTQEAPGGVPWDGPAGAAGLQWDGPVGTTGVQWESGPGESGVMTLTNAGTVDTPILFTIDGYAPEPSIVDIATDRALAYRDDVALNSELQINTGTKRAELDGANRRAQLTRTDWLYVPAGAALTVAFRGTDVSTTALLTAQWRDAWA